ncbi:MAG: TetR family transcriptional regulator [Acidobacteria bacterium]|nr:TetR family transcriptional regulator [Acidobacteriota bacterium]
MSRWEPNARGRLVEAALALYVERGFEQTTVMEIAKRAGLTERTFFRYFTDKREVLFWGAASLQELFVDTLRSVPESVVPIDAVAATLNVVAGVFQERREFALQRQSIIAVNPELQERELIKLASLTAAIAQALRSRGADELAADLVAHAGIAVFKVAFEGWVASAGTNDLAHMFSESFAELKLATGAGA